MDVIVISYLKRLLTSVAVGSTSSGYQLFSSITLVATILAVVLFTAGVALVTLAVKVA